MRLLQGEGIERRTTTSYNDANQVTTTATTVGGQPGYTFSQAYESTTGVSVGLSNNATGAANLATLSYNAQALVSSINYLTSSGIGSSLASDAFSYDGDLRPAGSTATWQSGSGSTGTLYSQGIGYDPAGNVLTQTMTQAAVPGQTGSGGTETQNFCYDEQNRMVYGSNSTATPAAGNGTCGTAAYQQRLGGTYTSSYVYTHLGQLWQGPYNGKGAYQYLYCTTSQPHQLTSVYPTNTNCGDTSGKTQSYGASYDSWGNMTTRTVTGATGTLTYDPQDLLVRWNGSTNNQAEWYMYDGSGSRVLRRSFDGTNITITVYAFGMEEHQYQYSGSGTTSTNTGTTYYYTLGGKLLGTLSGTSTLSTTFLLSDTLSSVVASISNTAGSATVLGNQAYGPYGNQRYVAGSLGTSKGYTGQYNDSLTGLDYYNARYYDPVVGRFLSVDTVQGNGQGMDPYAYVEGNPESRNDPTGKFFYNPGSGEGARFPTAGGPPSTFQYNPPPEQDPSTGGGGGGGCPSHGYAPTGCGGGYGSGSWGDGTTTQTRPTTYNSIIRSPSTGCNAACGRRDRTLITNKINDQVEGLEVLRANAVADGIAIVADGIAAFFDAAASNWTGFGLELAAGIARVAGLVGDLAKLGVFSLPPQIADALQLMKTVANVVDTIDGIVSLFNPVEGIAKQAATFLEKIAEPEVKAGIVDLFASALSAGAGAGYQKVRDVSYYDGLRTQVDGYTDQQAHDACVHQYLTDDPGEC